MKVLLTGATGFIGSYVYKELIQNNSYVSVISRKESNLKNWFQADILNVEETTKVVKEVQADVLIHLAWDVTHGQFWHAENNKDYEKASKSLFNSFIKNGGRKIVSVGTCAEYPTSSEAVSEDVIYAEELTPYGKAKRSVFDYLVSEQKKKTLILHGLEFLEFMGKVRMSDAFSPQLYEQ